MVTESLTQYYVMDEIELMVSHCQILTCIQVRGTESCITISSAEPTVMHTCDHAELNQLLMTYFIEQ